MMRWISLGLIALLALAACPPAHAAERWSNDVVDLFASLPVQDDGRVKPLDTLAQFTMLRINGKRTFTTESGERLDHMRWYLDALFYPELAGKYKCFIVDNSDAVTSIGVQTHEKRDRYSYDELKVGRQKLFELAQEYSQKEKADRSQVEQQVLNLANNFHEFETLIHFFDAGFLRFTATGDTETGRAFPEPEGVGLSETLTRLPNVLRALQQKRATLSEEQLNTEATALSNLMEQMRPAQSAIAIPLFPPVDKNEKEWRTPAELFERAFSFDPQMAGWMPMLTSLEKLPTLRDKPEAFTNELMNLRNLTIKVAEDRNEYGKVPLEVHYYRAEYLWKSMYLYIFSFLLVAVSWLLPRYKYVDWAVFASVALPTLLLIVGITLRCIIRSRPPVSTLYETILFITAVAIVVALVIELINRERIAIAVASLLGCAGMFLAFRYEAKEGMDTMPSLVAVLDTNFWLSTHVTTVTAGYAAGMLAGALAHIYILGQAFGFKRNDRAFYRNVARMTYGVLCFGLLFSTVGTILGGVWANDSWGRFWGWDPKENGALMICLWSLVVLHAKMGLYIRELGVSICAVILAGIVAFSWWGVNNLGVGLHSYGFTSGIWMWLGLFWAIECAVVLLGVGVHLRDRFTKPAELAPPPAPKQARA